MIDVERSGDVPSCLTSEPPTWDDEMLKQQLHEDFFGKCYLCEGPLPVSEIEVDHRHPKKIFPARKFDWTNLFPACGKCNGHRPRPRRLDAWAPVLSPGEGVEEQLRQWLDVDYGPQFDACDENNELARNTARELQVCIHREATDPRGRELRSAIEKHLNRALETYAEWREAADGSVEATKARRKLKRLVSRKSPFTMLVRSRLERFERICALFD